MKADVEASSSRTWERHPVVNLRCTLGIPFPIQNHEHLVPALPRLRERVPGVGMEQQHAPAPDVHPDLAKGEIEGHIVALRGIDFLVRPPIGPRRAVCRGEDTRGGALVGLEDGSDEDRRADEELDVVGVKGRVVELVEQGPDGGAGKGVSDTHQLSLCYPSSDTRIQSHSHAVLRRLGEEGQPVGKHRIAGLNSFDRRAGDRVPDERLLADGTPATEHQRVHAKYYRTSS
jgi:hypothetical protein